MTDHPEQHCEKCSGPNVSWFAPNHVWNAVYRSGKLAEPSIVCPICFVKDAITAGMDATGWCLAQEGEAERELLRLSRSLSDVTRERDRALDANMAKLAPFLPSVSAGAVDPAAIAPPTYHELRTYAVALETALGSLQEMLAKQLMGLADGVQCAACGVRAETESHADNCPVKCGLEIIEKTLKRDESEIGHLNGWHRIATVESAVLWKCPKCKRETWGTEEAPAACGCHAVGHLQRAIDVLARIPKANRFSLDPLTGQLGQEDDGHWILWGAVETALLAAFSDESSQSNVGASDAARYAFCIDAMQFPECCENEDGYGNHWRMKVGGQTYYADSASGVIDAARFKTPTPRAEERAVGHATRPSGAWCEACTQHAKCEETGRCQIVLAQFSTKEPT